MVHLDRIYTRGGDGGQTSLGDGTRVAKDDARIEAYGTVDELNAVLGLLIQAVGEGQELAARLIGLQHDLFDLGADLCVPGADVGQGRLAIAPEGVARLEAWIDAANQGLPALTSFTLPGGGAVASWLHLARTVCRRAERRTQTLIRLDPSRVNPLALTYLNRLSDLFFVLGRVAAGEREVLWKPGGGAAAMGDAP